MLDPGTDVKPPPAERKVIPVPKSLESSLEPAPSQTISQTTRPNIVRQTPPAKRTYTVRYLSGQELIAAGLTCQRMGLSGEMIYGPQGPGARVSLLDTTEHIRGDDYIHLSRVKYEEEGFVFWILTSSLE